MSDYIIRMIPADPCYHMDRQKADRIVNYLQTEIRAERMDVKTHDTPVFIDCGSNLEKIACPVCGAAIDFEWWGAAMDAAWKNRFTELSVTLPCCGGSSTLNDLRYHFPCGFSCVEFDILNPADAPGQECLSHIQGILGIPVRCIQAHL
ncbi:MAG: hypothetical protein NC121_06580 [Blautia sp.]|nr:hypothetical protein [Blautia sp.]